MPKKSGKKGKGKGKKKAKKTVAGAENIVHSLLKCYERNCGLTESQISPRIKNALRACKENETVLSTVSTCKHICYAGFRIVLGDGGSKFFLSIGLVLLGVVVIDTIFAEEHVPYL